MNPQRRTCLAAASALPLISLLEGCAMTSESASRIQTVIVDASGAAPGSVKTLQAALDAHPDDGKSTLRIDLRAGRYYEKIVITRPNVHLIGAGADQSVLTYDAYSGQTGPNGKWTTFGCATLIIRSTGFRAESMSIENGYDYPANDAKESHDPTREKDPQAVAVMTDTGADRAFFHKVRITGHQDTLFTHVGRSYFKQCFISGHVDFIFGAGQSLFEECDILCRARVKAGLVLIGIVTAPSTHISNKYGLVFLRCELLRENAKVHAESYPLGRPWHPTKKFADGSYADPEAIGSAVFIECHMDDHITSEGWTSMQGTQKSGPTRTTFLPEDSRFFEYKNTGPGAKTGSKRRQLSAAEAADYTPDKVLAGWKP